MERAVLITGASSGIGAAAARLSQGESGMFLDQLLGRAFVCAIGTPRLNPDTN